MFLYNKKIHFIKKNNKKIKLSTIKSLSIISYNNGGGMGAWGRSPQWGSGGEAPSGGFGGGAPKWGSGGEAPSGGFGGGAPKWGRWGRSPQHYATKN